MERVLKLIVCVLICESAGFIGAFTSMGSFREWYDLLIKPPFAPPNWLFGPVWTALYALMGVAAYLVWDAGWEREGVRFALLLFLVQLVLNALWTPLFFGLHQPLLAFIEILLMWVAIVATMLAFRPISTPAFILLIPYLLWVSFAAVLNFSLYYLNH